MIGFDGAGHRAFLRRCCLNIVANRKDDFRPSGEALASETGFLFDTAGAAGRIPVFGLLERGGEVRVILPPNCSEKHLPGAILEIVELDSIVYSDDWKAYNKLSINGFRHRWINHHNEFATIKNHGIMELVRTKSRLIKRASRARIG
ncbi:MAG: hypothetical protein GF403_11590 [Candidatus Coatesbacteria bacterium]|nr:hypothetical protein [Candidatus Coatesbacteria bacterium]